MAKKRKPPAPTGPNYSHVSPSKGRTSNNRRSRALQIVFGERPIVHVGGPVWKVPSETTSATYAVNMDRLTCECAYWRKMKVVCKHIEAVRLHAMKIKYDPDLQRKRLPNPYKNPQWYDKLAESELTLLTAVLGCLGRAICA